MSTAEFLTAPLLSDLKTVAHGFFTRRGGVSEGAFAALNCSVSSPDDPARVAENRRLAAEALGLPVAALHGLHQVHGTAVAVVEEAGWAPGRGPQADALVTRLPGKMLGIITADCTPVLFADAGAGVVGAAHAGWRGAVAGVLEETVAAMERLGAARGNITAAIGPCIRQPSYEVGSDLRDEVLARDAADARFFGEGRREDRWQFDLAGYCATRLAALGLGAISDLGRDTLAEEDRFFSHRRRTLRGEGPIGHQLSAIALMG